MIVQMNDIVTICIQLGVLCWAVFILYLQDKDGYAAPIYALNLLISDFLQIIRRLIMLSLGYAIVYSNIAFLLGILASVGLMVSIALERYLLNVHPLWYRCHHKNEHSVLISLAVWDSLILRICVHKGFIHSHRFVATFIILPLLLFVEILGDRYVEGSLSLHLMSHTKKGAGFVGTLVLVLGRRFSSVWSICNI